LFQPFERLAKAQATDEHLMYFERANPSIYDSASVEWTNRYAKQKPPPQILESGTSSSSASSSSSGSSSSPKLVAAAPKPETGAKESSKKYAKAKSTETKEQVGPEVKTPILELGECTIDGERLRNFIFLTSKINSTDKSIHKLADGSRWVLKVGYVKVGNGAKNNNKQTGRSCSSLGNDRKRVQAIMEGAVAAFPELAPHYKNDGQIPCGLLFEFYKHKSGGKVPMLAGEKNIFDK
jgi:hypothetical protein